MLCPRATANPEWNGDLIPGFLALPTASRTPRHPALRLRCPRIQVSVWAAALAISFWERGPGLSPPPGRGPGLGTKWALASWGGGCLGKIDRTGSRMRTLGSGWDRGLGLGDGTGIGEEMLRPGLSRNQELERNIGLRAGIGWGERGQAWEWTCAGN